MTDIRAALMEKSKKVGVKVDAGQADLFQRYMELLLEWNEKMNLTAITDPRWISWNSSENYEAGLEADFAGQPQ